MNMGFALVSRIAASTAGVFAVLLSLACAAQATTETLSGTFAGPTEDGGHIQASFTCAGTPTCSGQYTAVLRDGICTNTFQLAGSFVMSGLALGQSGALQGTVALEGAEFQVVPRTDGSCEVGPGGTQPIAFGYTATWNASSGTGSLAIGLDSGMTLPGTIRRDGTGTAPSGDATQVSGGFAGPVDTGGRVDIVFTCSGAPTCTGQYSLDETDPGCSNRLVLSGALVMSGLELANSGPVHGMFTLDGADYYTDRRSDGTCGVGARAPAALPFTGSWNAEAGTGAFTVAIPDAMLSGTFKADIARPPPVFPMTVSSSITATTATASAAIQYRPQDVGSEGKVYVFAVAPATIVKGGNGAKAMRIGFAKGAAAKADAPVACVLAQLSQAGDMVAVTADQLQAYLTGVFSAQGASVTILNGVPTVTVAGATFYVGYGASGSAMIDGGINRSAVTIPGSLACEPGPPQKGWWWNPLEDGRGFSLEVRGNNIFFAAFLYDVSGRSTWYVSTGPVSLDGSYYAGDLLSARGGQALGGAYPGFPTLASVGRVTITFNNASTGTVVWPGGTVPIQRFNIVPGGLNLAPVAGQPENGWWWNEAEAGRGFFMEWQGGNLDIAGYMYDDAGNSVWYLTTGPIGGTATARTFSGNWWSFGGGQALTGPWKPNTRLSDNVAPVTIQFNGPDKATMTLPNGRVANLYRHRF